MIKARHIVISAVILLSVPVASGQIYEDIRRRNFWNDSANATGIRTDSVTVSLAEVYGRYGDGGFRNYSDPDKYWSAGVAAATIVYTEKYSMAGSFSIDHTAGRNMSGSMFIRPGFYPIDVLDFTPGRKELQTYAFTGGISYDVAPRWRVGGGVDFTSANYAKRKDLRHTNYRLDMGLAPGAMYHNGNLAVGMAYIFRKNTESIAAEEVGTSADTYYAFLDKGLMYGAYEAWSGSGTHLDEEGIDGFPVKEIIHGGSVQVQWKNLYIDAEYLHGSGTVGEKETIWFRFPSHTVKAHAGYRFGPEGAMNFLRLNFDWSKQVNNENILGKETENGITITHVYGSNRIFERRMLTVNPEYDYFGNRFKVTAGAGLISIERLTAQVYPYVASQSMTIYNGYVAGTIYKGCFDIKAGLSFRTGNFTDHSRIVDSGSGAEEPPYHLTDYFNFQNEYMTATRIRADLALRWNIKHGVYTEAGAGYTHGFNLKYIGGSQRWTGTFKAGYNF